MTVAYALIALMLLRRSTDPRIVVALPIIANIAVTAYAAVVLLRFLLLTESGGVITRSAVMAQALFHLTLGAATAAVLSGLVGFWNGFAAVRGRKTAMGRILLAAAAGAFVACVGLLWKVTRTQLGPLVLLEQFAFTVCVVAGVLCLVGLPISMFAKSNLDEGGDGRWFRLFSMLSVMVAVISRFAAMRLQTFIANS